VPCGGVGKTVSHRNINNRDLPPILSGSKLAQLAAAQDLRRDLPSRASAKLLETFTTFTTVTRRCSASLSPAVGVHSRSSRLPSLLRKTRRGT
jgi:hypothetical protein